MILPPLACLGAIATICSTRFEISCSAARSAALSSSDRWRGPGPCLARGRLAPGRGCGPGPALRLSPKAAAAPTLAICSPQSSSASAASRASAAAAASSAALAAAALRTCRGGRGAGRALRTGCAWRRRRGVAQRGAAWRPPTPTIRRSYSAEARVRMRSISSPSSGCCLNSFTRRLSVAGRRPAGRPGTWVRAWEAGPGAGDEGRGALLRCRCAGTGRPPLVPA